MLPLVEVLRKEFFIYLPLEMQGSKIRPLWGTAQLFLHPRYMHGGATSSEVGVYAYAAAQVKKAMEVTHYLGGENYVFWGGREGYQTLLNTDMERELDHMARFFESAVAYKKKIGFNGNSPSSMSSLVSESLQFKAYVVVDQARF